MPVQMTPARVLAAASGCLLGAASLIDLAPTASAAEACPDVEVVFARGTNEPAGVGRVGQAFVDALQNELNGKTVDAYAVNYPAPHTTS